MAPTHLVDKPGRDHVPADRAGFVGALEVLINELGTLLSVYSRIGTQLDSGATAEREICILVRSRVYEGRLVVSLPARLYRLCARRVGSSGYCDLVSVTKSVPGLVPESLVPTDGRHGVATTAVDAFAVLRIHIFDSI